MVVLLPAEAMKVDMVAEEVASAMEVVVAMEDLQEATWAVVEVEAEVDRSSSPT